MAKSIYCCDCGKVRENPNKGCCNECGKIRSRNYRERLKNGHQPKVKTNLCKCGAEKRLGASYCQPCITQQSVEWRKKNGRKLGGLTQQDRDRTNAAQNARRKSTSKGRIRRKGTLINGVAVSCKACDRLREGWCVDCDSLYEWRKYRYHSDDEFNLKSKVRALTRSFIAAGKLIREPCEICGIDEDVEAHHDDYAKPMDIRWLCNFHHNEHHRKNGY